MQPEEVFNVVAKYLASEFEIPAEKIKLESNIFLDLDMDSIDALDLASRMHSELGVEANRDELKEIRSVQDVVDYILRNRKTESRG